ncbi:MAG: hypothetical protein Fur0018_12780 [Anaerolineales bacterium]
MHLFFSPLAAPPAYIDPNTGGMLFQLLAVLFAAFSGILLFFSRQIKTGLARLMRFFREKGERGGKSGFSDDDDA